MSIPTKIQNDDDDFGINFVPKDRPSEDDNDWEERSIDISEYKGSKESEQAGIWDYVNDAVIQPVLGSLKAFSWPLDVLKLGMIGEGLTDIDELEEISKREGVSFDRDKYVKSVLDQSEFIPTQDLLEDYASKKTGIDFKPKTTPGKVLNKAFFLRELTKGKGLTKSIQAGTAGSLTSQVLKESGGNELASDIIGDVVAGSAPEIAKVPRKLSQKAQELKDIGLKRGLPFMESMTRDNLSYSAKISKGRRAKLDKKLGMSSRKAIDEIVEERIPISKMRAEGVDLEAFEDVAYEEAKNLASANKSALSTEDIVKDIDTEIARIKSLAPSPSEGQRAAIKVLEDEKMMLEKAKPTTTQLINQRQNYNSNVKGIYRKSEITGTEEEVKNAYAFLNGSIDRTIEAQAGKEVADKYKVAREIYGQNQTLARTEGLLNKAFENGEYNAKKLNNILNSKQGQRLRKDLGEEAVKEIREIAEYGQKAQEITKQYASTPLGGSSVKEWGPLAGFLLGKFTSVAPKTAGALLAVKPLADYVRGWVLTNPSARNKYLGIIKDISNGSLKNVAADFAKLEAIAIDEYGSMEEFMKSGINKIQIFNDQED